MSSLSRRERRWIWATDVPFLACALAALAWLPAHRALNPLVCLVLVAGFALTCSVNISLPGGGYAPSVQLMFVPMLFFAPLHLVPLMVLTGYLIDDVLTYRRRRRPRSLFVLALGNCWWAWGPMLVLAAAGEEPFAWEHWPLLALALAAQLGVGAVVACVRVRLHDGQWLPLRELGVPIVVDVVLTLPALGVVAVAAEAPVGAALMSAALLVIAGGFTRERSGRLVERANATHDALTGLPNRLLFDELASAASARARRDGEPCAVLLIDLDAFKAVNDELGHAAGDRVLVQAAARLLDSVRGADAVARLGGDEFAVLLAGHQTVDACEKVADKLQRAFEVPFGLPAGPRCVGVSIGAALIDGDRAFDEALHEADTAMYANKAAQSSRFVRHRQLAPQRS